MAIHLETRYLPAVASITRPTVKTDKTQAVADTAFSSLAKIFTSPGGYAGASLAGVACVCLCAFLIGGPLGWGLAVAVALAVVIFIAVCDPLSHIMDEVVDGSPKCPKTAQEPIEEAQQAIPQSIISPSEINAVAPIEIDVDEETCSSEESEGAKKCDDRESGTNLGLFHLVETDDKEIALQKKGDVKKIKALLNESFGCCEVARQVLENAQQAVKKKTPAYSKISVKIDREESRVPFGAQCYYDTGLIELLYPDIDSSLELPEAEKQYLLIQTLYELINIHRSHTTPETYNLDDAIADTTEENLSSKAMEYALSCENWESGSDPVRFNVCCQIMEEMDSKGLENHPERQRWKDAALNHIKSICVPIIQKLSCNPERADFITPEAELCDKATTWKEIQDLIQVKLKYDARSNFEGDSKNIMDGEMKNNQHTGSLCKTLHQALPRSPKSRPTQCSANLQLKPSVAIEGLLPAAHDLLAKLAVEAHLHGKVGVGVAVIEVPSLMLVVELDEDLFVMPGRSGDI